MKKLHFCYDAPWAYIPFSLALSSGLHSPTTWSCAKAMFLWKSSTFRVGMGRYCYLSSRIVLYFELSFIGNPIAMERKMRFEKRVDKYICKW